MNFEKRQKGVALALSCGGARGLAHIGVIRELERRGYVIHNISGCSMGSVVGAFYAMGRMSSLSQFMESLSLEDMADYLDFTISSGGFIKAKRFIDKLKTLSPDRSIESLPVELTIVATNLTTGKEEVFTQGSIYAAVRASIAIPAVITSVRQDGEVLVDGGIVNPMPLNHLHASPGDIKVAVNLYGTDTTATLSPVPVRETSNESPLAYLRDKYHSVRTWRSSLLTTLFRETTDVRGYVGTLRAIVDLMTQRLIEAQLRVAPPDVVIDVPMACASVFDFNRAKDLILLGEQQARAALDRYEAQFATPWWRRKWRRFRF